MTQKIAYVRAREPPSGPMTPDEVFAWRKAEFQRMLREALAQVWAHIERTHFNPTVH